MQSVATSLQIDNLPNPKLAYSNRVYVNPEVFTQLERLAEHADGTRDPQLLTAVAGHVFFCAPHKDVPVGKIGLNQLQRKIGQFMLNQSVSVEPFPAGPEVALASITLKIDLLTKNKAKSAISVDGDQMSKAFQLCFGSHVFEINQEVAFDFQGTKFAVTVESLDHAQFSGERSSKHLSHGQLLPVTDIVWARGAGALIQLSGSSGQRNALFSGGFNFEKLGIGGLQHEFEVILRRAFASRIFPSQIVKQLGVNHVRGMLLYGPPGCGKTLIARQIGKVLNARDPKIVNGPEILDKYVGGSEEKIRELFADAEREQQTEGDGSMLHIIIFDEIDAICKSRGTVRDGTGVSDSVVNQLLSKIDGVDSLNNILIIGMTNRKDMIDEALLRPGRLEVHVEIGLPDQHGRNQILNIHTSPMRQHNRITAEAVQRIPELSERTKNFTGAEIEGLVKASVSYALSRCIDVDDISKAQNDSDIVVGWQDFERALDDVQPAFGAPTQELQAFYSNGIVNYGPAFDDLELRVNSLIQQVRNSARTPLMSLLLEGSPRTGKSALAARAAIESGFPFVRMISADTMIGLPENAKCANILKVFNDSYKSPLSIIFIDDIERIIDYTPIGPRFSNMVLQTLLVLLRKVPPEGRKLFVVATTSISHLLEDLQLVSAFTVELHVSELQNPSETKAVLRELLPLPEPELEDVAAAITKPIGIKQLLIVTEMARQENDAVTPDALLACLHTCGY